MEGVDYEISKDGTKIVKLTEGNWNEDSEENALFAFELFKGVESVEGDKIVVDSKLTSITNHVILESGVSEVEIGINGFNAENDMMLVFKNGVNMVEGVDYEVQGGKIVSTGEVWNENGLEDYGMTFVVFKEVVEYNGDAEVKAENIADGSIGMDKLADDVKGAIEEASNIDLSGYVEQEEYNGKIAEFEGKVNEAFTSANNGKQLIANAIGEPVSAEDTFSAMSNDINSLLSTFKTNMMNNGITVECNDRFKQLIDKIATMVEEGVGKGIQMTSDEINSLSNNTYTTFDGLYSGYVYGSGWNRCNYIELSLNFTPTIILVQSTINTSGSSPFTIYSTTTYDNFSKNGIISKAEFTCSATANNDGSLLHFSPKIENGKYILPVRAHNTNYPIGTIHCTWLAIGVGEEDTTLRDSLASILEGKGVEVTEEDDMADLITKVDEEFDRQNEEISGLEDSVNTLTNEKNDLEEDAENTRSTLAGLMQEGGYDISDSDDMNSILNLLISNGIRNAEYKHIACDRRSAFVLKNDGSLWACGENAYGQLGVGGTTDKTTFTQVTTYINNDVKQVDCGDQHTFILKNDGSLWSCGINKYGQLGLGTSDTNVHSTFTQVTTNINNDVKQVVCGYNHTFILKNDDTIWYCGNGSNGALGDGSSKRTSFTQLSDTNVNTNVKQIVIEGNNTFILKNDGNLWACGGNNYGSLGLGVTDQQNTFTQVTNNVKEVFTSGYHTFILKNDGSVWSCGCNTYGQLGLGTSDTNAHSTFTQVMTNVDNIIGIYCGADPLAVNGSKHGFSMILKNDGS